MIGLSDTARSILTRSHRRFVRVESWYGGELLSDDVPVSTAREEVDRSLRVPERITLSVPRIKDGISWSPVSKAHPLSANGQRLRISLGIGLSADSVEWFTRGWFLIYESRTDGDRVDVAAVGLLHLIDEARLVSPYQPSGTLADTLRGLIEPALTVDIDAALSDRTVPSDVNYDEDRLGAVLELLDAWPAEASVDPEGSLSVRPVSTSTVPVLSLTNGVGGTIIKASGSSGREGVHTVAVARGTAPDGAQVQGVAYGRDYGSPFNPLAVPVYFQSPLLTTVAMATAAAKTVMAREERSAAQEFSVECVPNPALQAGDVVSITTNDYTDLPCSVEGLTLPYTAGGGAQTLTVRSLV